MGKGGIFNVLIGLAVLLAVGSILLVVKMIDNAREEGRASAKPVTVEMTNVLVAAADIEMGAEIRPEMVPIKSVPKEFTTADTITSFDQVKGKVAGSFIPAGDMLFTTKVKNADQLSKASLVITPGNRLITIPSDFEISVSYMIKNGDHVDILAVFLIEKVEKNLQGEWKDREMTVTLLQNVKVFDIQFGAVPLVNKSGASQGEESGRLGKGTTVTFEVTPEEAERMVAAFSKAKSFKLTLRRFDDNDTAKTSSVMETEILKPFLPAAPPPAPVTEAPKAAPTKPKYNY